MFLRIYRLFDFYYCMLYHTKIFLIIFSTIYTLNSFRIDYYKKLNFFTHFSFDHSQLYFIRYSDGNFEQLTRRRLPEISILIELSKGVNDIASLNNKISLECNEAKTYY